MDEGSQHIEDRAASKRFVVSPERAARRRSIDRNNMRAVYEQKSLAYKAAKSVFDIALSAGGLLVLSPLFLVTAIAIVIEDGFPVFYSSVRPGKDMKEFPMHKFRSMYKDADARLGDLMSKNEQHGAAFKIKDDPRVTRVGRFIRKYSIDELPQLINVLTGEMSIVGPRPIVPAQPFNKYEEQRQIVQPGLTCYWQVSGRSNIAWEDWIELDLDYIQDMSLLTDLRIILRTFKAVFESDGSY